MRERSLAGVDVNSGESTMTTRSRGRRSRIATVGRTALACLATMGAATGAADAQTDGALALVRNAVRLTGEEETLRSVTQVSFDMITQWQRTSFRALPFTDRPSFEPHRDVRDYSIPAWRNTRDFGTRSITNVVRDSVAVTDLGQGFRPLSSAYVDERDELFVYTPDRLLLALLDAPDLDAEPDTALGGEPHAVVAATLADRYPARVYFHRGSGLPTLLRFRAGHPNDFGLVQWGEMAVEIWYSGWRTFGAVSIPTQWDILRVGVPYKRMTVRGADFDPTFAADSFAVGADEREAWFTSPAPRPMHESVTIRDARMAADGVAVLDAFGLASPAVETGDGWLAIGAGQAPFNFEQSARRLEELGATPITRVLVAETRGGNGGVLRAAELGLPILVSESAETLVRVVLRNGGGSDRTVDVVDDVRTVGSGAKRVELAPVDLPDAPGSLMIFKPSLGWLFLPDGADPLDVRLASERARALGWKVERVGTLREVWPTGM